ncbi:DUF3027 domain-containing protein [Brevibacterium luteolum]|uniref:DUF3027 domain-containing protein n=1 Tax=Brevibacterium luteolum TaxID=199591 RepID=UPI00223BC583|nr:DUF3027 domain-containing protein [Brevibacterium luteolum]MCT1874014.1 DUF3027 domain-containing protein [Brevibacterium luteolum]MCT1891283.1 DUF3027 domain-containing protein [Brevibacterium luteolum]MCT1892031.1 DUF3027 domain-containing protein [Brevibacterium luteolum]MCT1922530.1 DUF3027 domain-containing protein [Brevibacterium luteolum]MCT1924736.1 DUF3027 domain-containing protein [Brevibacterium luteolum]
MSHLFDAWLEVMRASRSRTGASPADSGEPAAAAAPEAGELEAAAAADPQSAETAAEAPRTSRRSAKIADDALLLAAVDIAREAIAEAAEAEHIGGHLSAVMEGQRLATHAFACTMPGYRGWHWVAVLARAPRSKKVTVCETALLPGEDALVAPRWVPWSERLQPGDMSARDVLPKVLDDPNLEQSFEQVGGEDTGLGPDDEIDQIPNFEWGLGRRRVLSREGIANAATRWENSDAGPEGDFARRASAHCSTCGYLMPMAGSLRTQFGVCANEWSPFDGRVVALDNGCGAHSETDERRKPEPIPDPVIDDLDEDFDMVATTSDDDSGSTEQSVSSEQPGTSETSGADTAQLATASGAAEANTAAEPEREEAHASR